ncbi:unnamed protein product [Soboliphyme baturini]|uniref:MCM_lid domain-containing protein n=1 Tax=Soboliphyme baturini TaxID=241478 RepID=A0A183J6T5_9BILA|nr:unnamed protein product [Soboliphyme baturini]
MLDSLIRLSQAHARLMYRDTVTVQDSVMAVSFIEATMQGLSLLDPIDVLHYTMPDDPELEYQDYAHTLINKLELNVAVIEPSPKKLKFMNTSEKAVTKNDEER